MPILLLIRHGENEFVKTGRMAGRLPEVHLNDYGKKQASELAEALGNLPIKAVYSSPLERARETGTPLVEKLSLEIHIRDGLIETGIGDWAGLEIKTLRKRPEWKIVQENPSRFRFPNGESFAECQTRLVNEVEAILKAHTANEMIVCVSHADPIKLLIAYYLGMPLDNFQRLGCETASVNVLKIDEKNAILAKLNQRAPYNFTALTKVLKKGKK